ncbi:MAG TPA: hypothetical protein VNZ58_02225 [Thermomicrobiales bacterium]|nr:hypothetical protein [Thermomicrobiales bacterium]
MNRITIQGESAYELAVRQGFSGTETDWLAGLKGADGRDGIDGTPGTPGRDGIDGDTGKSAYEIAVINGFEGSEGEWIESLRGEVGPEGPDGEQGETGPEGPQGPQGPPGAGLFILDILDDEADLPAEGSAGDAYLIGGIVYTWIDEDWANIGPLQGPQGPEGPQGVPGTTTWEGIEDKPTIPSKTSDLTNDSGFLTAHQDISGLVPKTTTVNGHALSSNVSVTKADVSLGNVTNDAQVKVSDVDTSTSLGSSDTKVPSQKAVKSYVDTGLVGKANASHTHTVSDITTDGTASNATFLRGDGRWAGVTGGGAVSVTALTDRSEINVASMLTAEMQSGTATLGKVISPATLKAAIGYHPPASHTHTITSAINVAFDGAGSPLEAQDVRVIVPWACTLAGWRLAADVSGSVTATIVNDGTSVTISSAPKLTSQKTANGSLSSSLIANTILRVSINAATSITNLVVMLSLNRSV